MPDETDRTQKVTSVEIIKENNNDSLFTLKKDSNRANLINPDLNTKKLLKVWILLRFYVSTVNIRHTLTDF